MLAVPLRRGGEGGNQLPAPQRLSGEPRQRPPGADGTRNPDRGWTVFQTPSTPLFTLGRWMEHVRLRSGGRRTRSSLSGRCGRAGAGGRQCRGEGRRPRFAAPLERGGPRPRDRRRRTRGTSSPLPSRTTLTARALWPGIPSVWPPACALSPPPAASSGFLPLQVPWRRCRRIQVCIAQCFFLQATWI